MKKKIVIIITLIALIVVVTKYIYASDINNNSSFEWNKNKKGYRITIVDNQGNVISSRDNQVYLIEIE